MNLSLRTGLLMLLALWLVMTRTKAGLIMRATAESPDLARVNGIDVDIWDPEADKLLAATYSPKTLKNRVANRKVIEERFALDSDDYLAIGARLRRLGVPVLFVFEGGYATDEVGLNAVNVLVGFSRG